MALKHKKTGLTLVEILVVLSIIALLAGLLLPAMTVVKNTAKEAKQKAQFSSINLALVTFKNDYGDYPSSQCPLMGDGSDYSGAQRLAEALVGWDLLGFHPKSEFRSNGQTLAGDFIYDTTNDIFMAQRKDLYIDRETANAFKLGDMTGVDTGLFTSQDVVNQGLAPNTYVLTDVFNKRKVILPDNSKVNAGTPILYYRANTSMKNLTDIYKEVDNEKVVFLNEIQPDNVTTITQPLGIPDDYNKYFYDYIVDPKTLGTPKPQPYRPDSFILISAGLDGIYGTADDIKNFGN